MQRKFGFSRLSFDLIVAAHDFLGAAPGSFKGHLNQDELVRILVTALLAGGGTWGLLRAVVAVAPPGFLSPADTGLAAAVLSLILETFRRLGHGRKVVAGVANRRYRGS